MRRFFGMMPSSEIEKEERIRINDLYVTVQAGPNGWTILYTDGSSEYQDIVDTTENNYKSALKCLCKRFDINIDDDDTIFDGVINFEIDDYSVDDDAEPKIN